MVQGLRCLGFAWGLGVRAAGAYGLVHMGFRSTFIGTLSGVRGRGAGDYTSLIRPY